MIKYICDVCDKECKLTDQKVVHHSVSIRESHRKNKRFAGSCNEKFITCASCNSILVGLHTKGEIGKAIIKLAKNELSQNNNREKI